MSSTVFILLKLISNDGCHRPPLFHCIPMSAKSHAIQHFSRTKWLARLPHPLQQALLEKVKIEHVKRGTILIKTNERDSPLHFLHRGSVEVSLPRLSLDVAPLMLLTAGAWLGVVSALSDLPSPVEYRACSDLTVITLPRFMCRDLSKSPSWTSAVLQLLADSMSELYQCVGPLTFSKGEQRIRSTLITMAESASGDGQGPIFLLFSQSHLASVTLTSRFLVCKVFNELKRQRIIRIGYRKIIILDLERLREGLVTCS